MAETTIQQRLVAIIRDVRQQERDVVASLSDEVRDTNGTIHDWGAKNIIIHIASARYGLANDIATGRAGQEVVPFNAEWRNFNDTTFLQHENDSWGEVNAYADAAVDTLIAEIEQYDDGQLSQPHLQPWMSENESLTMYTLGLGLEHPLEHVAQLYAAHGNPETASTILESIFPLSQSFGTPVESLGALHYNVACYLARMGKRDAAMPHLRDAFTSRPDLMEWAKQDTDLDSLRADPDFQAFYNA